MGFSLKKFISFFLDPFVILFLLVLLGFVFLLFNSYKKAKVTLLVSLAFGFLASSSIVSNSLIEPLETKYEKKDYSELQDIKYVLLLGGDFKTRAYEALKLYNSIEGLKIITSGYAGNRTITQAEFSKLELIKLGVNENDIITQEKPRDTIEEARYVKNIVQNEQFILVTSPSHMPRAMKIFQKEGLSPIPMISQINRGESKSHGYLGIGSIKKVDMAMHEYIGMLWLDIKDFIKND